VSFLLPLALAIGVLVALPIAAHLLRRSRTEEQEFPPAALVPKAQPVARQRRHLEDRALLGTRALMILALAALGAIPLVQCSRLSLDRQRGASVALAIVLDDSLSMRAKTSKGPTRWELALDSARELVSTTREGDAVAIVLAGEPARLVMAATTDLGQAERTLSDLAVSDRPTALADAVQVARAALSQLPHQDRRVAVLSDWADGDVPDGQPPVWAPLAALRGPLHDCGIVSAQRGGRRVTATIACSSSHTARERKLEVIAAEPGSGGDAGTEAKVGEVLATTEVGVRQGAQTLDVEVPAGVALDVRLTGNDDIESDNRAPVAERGGGLGVGLLADPATSTVITGGGSLLEQAIGALGSDVSARPMPVLPDEPAELESLAALVLDDPPGIPAEARASVGRWLRRGGVGLAFLGPRSETAQLGSTLEPFLRGAVRWESTKAKGADVKSLAWLGDAAASLSDIDPTGRALLAGAEPAGARVVGRWADGQPLILESRVGRGLLLAVGLPVSAEVSDLALRPAFLALLDYAVEQARRRAGPRQSVAGRGWTFATGTELSITGPGGELALDEVPGPSGEGPVRIATPSLAGRYRVQSGKEGHERVVTPTEEELLTQSRDPQQVTPNVRPTSAAAPVDASREISLLIGALLLAELILRALRRMRRASAA
jgi:hypothetical protein